MSMEEILDKLDDAIEEAWILPLSKGKRVVDADRIQELIEDIRLNVPTEIKQAKSIVSDRNEIVTSARNEADLIINKAKERAKMLVNEDGIILEAKAKAKTIIEEANKKSEEIKKVATSYADNLLKVTEEHLSSSLKDIRKAINYIKNNSSLK